MENWGEYGLLGAALLLCIDRLAKIAYTRKNGKAPTRVEIEPVQMSEFRQHFGKGDSTNEAVKRIEDKIDERD